MPRKKHSPFVLCVNNDGYPVSLEARKVYRAVRDPSAAARGFVRVIDESGEDYLYPAELFVAIEVPPAAAEMFQASAESA
jgi:hypothetical protein